MKMLDIKSRPHILLILMFLKIHKTVQLFCTNILQEVTKTRNKNLSNYLWNLYLPSVLEITCHTSQWRILSGIYKIEF